MLAPVTTTEVRIDSDQHSAERNVPLDGIRGIAILLAVAYHAWQDVPALTTLDRAVGATVSFFWTGVDLFFVLSGFLITRILYKSRNSPRYFRSFYARRMLRTWPLYYFALILVLGVPAFFAHRLVEESAFWFLFHSSNFLTFFFGYPRRIVAHFWSLAIEEQYYLVWPMIRFLRTRERMMILCGVLIGSAVALRLALLMFAEANSRQVYSLTFTRMDALATGGLLGLWLAKPGDPLRRRRILGGIAAICGAVLAPNLLREGGDLRIWSALAQTLNYTAIAGLGAVLIGWSQLDNDASILNRALSWRRLLPFLGKYSYSMYMFHIWFDAAARAGGVHPSVNRALRGVLGSTVSMGLYFPVLLAAIAVWVLVTWNLLEKRFLALKARFEFHEPEMQAAAAGVRR